MKNNMKKLAAALLSGTMLLGMTGSVFAADAQTGAELLSVPYWLMGGTALAGLLGSRITGKRRKDRKKKFF